MRVAHLLQHEVDRPASLKNCSDACNRIRARLFRRRIPMAAAPRHVLDGIKALDFTQFVAGPTVTKLMAEMGAEVIKVELAPDGDRSRAMPFVKNERSGYFVQQNRGKLSLCLDPRSEDGKTIIRNLITK